MSSPASPSPAEDFGFQHAPQRRAGLLDGYPPAIVDLYTELEAHVEQSRTNGIIIAKAAAMMQALANTYPSPTGSPVQAPADAPVLAPTGSPVQAPADAPMLAPVLAPVLAPADAPMLAPADVPTQRPTGLFTPIAEFN